LPIGTGGKASPGFNHPQWDIEDLGNRLGLFRIEIAVVVIENSGILCNDRRVSIESAVWV